MAAEERLMALADPAITRLAHLIDNADTDAVRLGAVKDALDRAGFKPTEKVQTNHSGDIAITGLREALGLDDSA